MDQVLKCNIAHWNAQSLRPKLIDFENFLCLSRIHIAAVSETWLEPGSNLSIKDYTVYRNDRDDSYGGIIILTHRSIQSQLCSISHSNSGIQMLMVKIHNCDFIEHIISVYCPSSVNTTQNDWDHIFSLNSNKTLIIGDFNAHHSNWSYKTDTRGLRIYDAMADYNYISLNDGAPTRIKMVNGYLRQSSPDISISSADISYKFNWKVTNESLGSDHLIVVLSSAIQSKLSHITKRNFKQADWNKYQETAEVHFRQFQICENDLQNSYNSFIEILHKAADASIPKLKLCQNPSNKFKPKPYWSPTLSKAVAERRLALSSFRKNPTPNNLSILQTKINNAQKLIRRAKIEGFNNFCSSLDSSVSTSDMWRRMRWLKGYKSTNAHIDSTIASNLLDNLCPDFNTPPEPVFTSSNQQLETPITRHELEKCIKPKDTAPGCDDISYSMIKNLPDIGKNTLLTLYNMFLAHSFIPKQWRQIRVVPIPKHGRDPTSSAALRPISLISCICKILHSILNNRLEWFLEHNGFFSHHTIGFRKGRSCQDNLTSLVSKIQIGLSNNHFTVACFLDIENAYNNLDISTTLLTLDNLGCGTTICRYLWDFLKERQLMIKGTNYNLCRYTGRGLAQGDPLSPLLFNLATMHICKSMSDIGISQYADDFALYVTSNSIPIAVSKIQLALNSINSYFSVLNLTISTNKSKVILFRRGQERRTININVTIENNRLERVECVKYLGVWLDRSLRWRIHISDLQERVLKILNIFKVLSGSGWGVHPKHLRRLYISIMRSRIDYASFLYDNSPKRYIKKLDNIQNQAMRIIGGFVRTTPIHAMENELSLHPLYLRRRYLAGKYWLRCKAGTNRHIFDLISELTTLSEGRYWFNKKTPLLTQIHNKFNHLAIYSSNQLGMFSLNSWVTNIDTSKSICTSIDTIKKPKKHFNQTELKSLCCQYLNNKYSNSYQIYTDGSIEDTDIGAAFYDIQEETKMLFKIIPKVSIMEAELIAIAEALAFIASTDHSNSVILSDSKSALQHVARCTSTFRGTPIAYSILTTINIIQQAGRSVVLQWIPAHIGLVGNEIVDNLAKKASREGIRMDFPPYFSNYIPLLKKHCFELFSEYLNKRSVEKAIWYRTVQPNAMKESWIMHTALNRNTVVIALRFRSGHTPCNKLYHLMKKVDSPLCLSCNKIDDIYHLLMECARNANYRPINTQTYDVGYCSSVLAVPGSDAARALYKLASRT